MNGYIILMFVYIPCEAVSTKKNWSMDGWETFGQSYLLCIPSENTNHLL